MKKLSIKKGVQCMACLECVRACSNAYGRLTTRRLIRWTSSLQPAAFEYLQSIEGADRICWSAPFCG